MKNRLLIIIFFCLLAGCHNASQTRQREALESRVLRVHDEAMADMDLLFVLRQDLKKLSDSLSARQPDTATRQLVEKHIVLLAQADEAMMQWMNHYKSPSKEQALDSTMRYLQDQLQKIEQVKKTMDSTLAAAQQIYQQHERKK
jgi:hypothetical protein